MSDSVRKQVADAIVTAISGCDNVTVCTQDYERYGAMSDDDMPVVYIDTEITDREQISFLHPTAADFQATMLVQVETIARAYYGAATESAIDVVAQQIEAALLSNAALSALIVDVQATEQQQTWDVNDTYGMCSQAFELAYTYNHNTP